MDAKKTAQQVLEQVGGAENVTFLTHCVTRLRFNLKSMDGVDEAKVKAVPGVVGVVNKGGQYQVIIGNEVAAVYDELMKLGDFGGKEVKQPAAPAEEKKSRISQLPPSRKRRRTLFPGSWIWCPAYSAPSCPPLPVPV